MVEIKLMHNLYLRVGTKAIHTVKSWKYESEIESEISVDVFPVLQYQALGVDFGPLDLATTSRFIGLLDRLMTGKNKVELVSPADPQKLSNLVVLVLAYLTVKEISTVKKLRQLVAEIRNKLPALAPFVCPLANKFPTIFHLEVEDVLEALVFGRGQGWLQDVDPEKLEFLQHPHNGDLNTVVPGKFVAFAGPSSFPGETCTPAALVPTLKHLGVSTVVRLNHPRYAAEDFRSSGLDHHDLIFPDGSCPEGGILSRFLEISDSSEGLVAVHCKAGLGRTGTLIAFWLMKKFRISARVAIAWLRIVRPGSVLGPQQQFLQSISDHLAPVDNGRGGDRGQGARLLKRKRTNN